MKKRVCVVDEETRPKVTVMFRCHTIAEAEAWIGNRPDLAKVKRGGYGIDAPEGMKR